MSAIDDLRRRILQGVDDRGFHYEAAFSSDSAGVRLVRLARRLGPLFIPEGLDPERPVITSKPSADAPAWRPFDRREGIGWHNDFSTAKQRPEATLIWIDAPDPRGAGSGDWRVAATDTVISRLEQEPDGAGFVRRLRTEALPFGYEDDEPTLYRILEPIDGGHQGLRFYGRALIEGAHAHLGHVPRATRLLVKRISRAADAVGTVLPACRGALLVVDNRRSLHDRTQQAVRGSHLRRSVLCFVEHLC